MAPTVRPAKNRITRTEVNGTRWWLVKGEEQTASAVFGWLDRLRVRSRSENFRDAIWEAVYTGRPLGQETDYVAFMNQRQVKGAPGRLNVIESVVDTVVSKLSKRRPMPVVSADDAGWSEKLFARRVSRVLRRKMGGEMLEREMPEILKDACVRGTGAVKVYACDGDVTCERIPRYECVVDPREARYGKPRTLVHTKSYASDVLVAQFPQYEAEIMRAAKNRVDDWQPFDFDSPTEPDMVQVAEAWRLGPKGRHVIAIRGQLLFDEPWTRPRFPIVFAKWKRMPRGMWGKGIVEILAGIQAFIDGEFKDIQEAFYWASALITFAPRGSNIVKEHLRARHPAVVEHDGAVPQYVAPNPVSPQRLQFFWSLVERMYQIAGVSELSASSKNPLGSNASGKAIDTMYDIESDRFSDEELEYAWMRVEVGRAMLDEARALVEKVGADDTSKHERRESADEEEDEHESGAEAEDGVLRMKDLAAWIREIGGKSKWAKFDIDGGPYHLIMEPQNFVPESRGGRMSTIGEFGKAGLETDKTKLLAGFEEPDIQRYFRDVLAPYNATCAVLEEVGDLDCDMPYVDPQFAPYDQLLSEAKNEYLDAKSRRAPEEVLQRYRDFIQLVVAEKQNIAPPAPMPGAGGLPGQSMAMMGGPPPMPQPPMAAPGGAPAPQPLMPPGIA